MAPSPWVRRILEREESGETRAEWERHPKSETPSRISAPPGLPARILETPSPESPGLAPLPPGANIHARAYRLALPSAEELRRKLLEWTEAP